MAQPFQSLQLLTKLCPVGATRNYFSQGKSYTPFLINRYPQSLVWIHTVSASEMLRLPCLRTTWSTLWEDGLVIAVSVIFVSLIQILLSLFLIWPRYLVYRLPRQIVANVLTLFSLSILLSFYYVHLSVCLPIHNNFSIYVVAFFLCIIRSGPVIYTV